MHLNCSSLHSLTSFFPPAIKVLMCFSCRAPSCLSSCVVSELCWNLTSRPSGDDRKDESLNQYLPVFLLSPPSFLLFDSVLSKPVRRVLCFNSLTFYGGTPMFRKYPGSCGQPEPVVWLSPAPTRPLLTPRCRRQRTTPLAKRRRTKAMGC